MTAPAERSEREATVEFGPRDIQFVPLGSIVPLEQVRKEYAPEALEELKDSMVRETDEGLEFNLLNPLVVAQLDSEHAARYVAELNTFWDTEFSLADLPADEASGDYLILIAGHRRLRSIHGIVEDHELDRDTVRVSVVPHHNISFEDAIVLQLHENIYERPNPTEEAEAIRMYYEAMRRKDARYTKAACARALNFSPEKIQRALAYSSLPDQVKDLVRTGVLSYGVGIEISRAQVEYLKRYHQLHGRGELEPTDELTTPEEFAEYDTFTLAMRICAKMQRERIRGRRLEEHLRAVVADLRQRNSFEQGEFDLMLEEYNPHVRRSKAVRDLGAIAAHSLGLVLGEDPDFLLKLQHENPGLYAKLLAHIAEQPEQLLIEVS
jgi:hypothetical protein